MFADAIIIYASADNVELLKHKLKTCMNSITRWYSNKWLSINNKKSNVMIIGCKLQLQSLQLDHFSIPLDSDKLELVERAKYLSLYVKWFVLGQTHIENLSKYELFYSCSSSSSQNISQKIVTKSIQVVHTIETGVWFKDMRLYYSVADMWIGPSLSAESTKFGIQGFWGMLNPKNREASWEINRSLSFWRLFVTYIFLC